jgi:hypothetical protein
VIKDISELEPGLYAAPERWLSDEQLGTVARHIKSIDLVWNRVLELRENVRLEDELSDYMWEEIRTYTIQQKWRMSGSDQLFLMTLLERLAADDRKFVARRISEA